jgi:hypothetical protein
MYPALVASDDPLSEPLELFDPLESSDDAPPETSAPPDALPDAPDVLLGGGGVGSLDGGGGGGGGSDVGAAVAAGGGFGFFGFFLGFAARALVPTTIERSKAKAAAGVRSIELFYTSGAWRIKLGKRDPSRGRRAPQAAYRSSPRRSIGRSPARSSMIAGGS